ncbi:hypothetical protein C7M84_014994 [Penaeus vannamei]|uniref:L-Fucosyltransferase n=1 Tax=Penaeus vannamei TaxID=6689 RepID=A0A423SRV2_PENVA|nr:hypothetical protein C7M84_014994 [Penaeus vannamei]
MSCMSVREILADVQQKWQSQQQHCPPVLVGFHVRRTDYASHASWAFGSKLPGTTYFTRALNYYRKKFSNKVAFVAASDDMAFVRRSLVCTRMCISPQSHFRAIVRALVACSAFEEDFSS